MPNNRRHNGMFKPGQSGNPAGKPKGSKHKFTQLRDDWIAAYQKKGGPEWLMALPDDLYIRIGQHVIPKDYFISASDGAGNVKFEFIISSGDDADE